MQSNNNNNILFPTDFSEISINALNYAINFCKQANNNLVILSIIDAPFSLATEEDVSEIDLITHDLINFSNIKLNKIKDNIEKEHEFTVTVETYVGNITPAIERAVKNYNAKKIIMATKVTKDLFFNSNSYIIVKNTLVPLLTINGDEPVNDIKHILFPFNEKTITIKKADEVIKLARIHNSKIILLGVCEAINNEHTTIITNQMMYVKSIFDAENIQSEIHFSANQNYAEAILEFCNNNTIDLITIANNLSDTLKAALSLNSTKIVINNAKIPVLTIPVWQGI